jgi:orotate phosphoribosyltransferase
VRAMQGSEFRGKCRVGVCTGSRRCPLVTDNAQHAQVLQGLASNVKNGPFTATSGAVLPYYLNASTNFLDKNIAPKIVTLFAKFMAAWLPKLPRDAKYIVCGMEMAGGIIASQLASANNEGLNQLGDFVYIRKEKKTSGTCQQLEGPNFITTRTPDSQVAVPFFAPLSVLFSGWLDPLYQIFPVFLPDPFKSSPIFPVTPQVATGVWVDDANSTGSSLKAGIEMLKSQYNIEVTHALYLVDRFQDRQNLTDEKQHLASPVFDNVEIKALYDLDQVDQLIPKIPGCVQ